ncbi:MAG: diguanylate cyclase [Rhodocyclaceae bacterium]|nr:diguanylate cyclase [Rhodocyclaceae bacterium]
MSHAAIRVLLVEENAADARLIQEALAGAGVGHFHVEWVTQLAAALERLGRDGIEIVLLDLMLPDGQGVEVFDRVFQAAPDALILVLSAANDEETALQAVQRGAHDYLAQGHVDAHWLPRALRYFIERKNDRDALRKSEVRFRTMSDAAPLGIFVADAQGCCVYTNAAYHTLLGLTFEQTVGTHWATAIHSEDRPRVLAEWAEATQSREPFLSEVRFTQSDDRIVWARLNAAEMRDGTASLGHVLTVEDITERKAAEEALFDEKERAQVTLNSIGDAVLTTDLQSNVTYLNPVAEAMTGWSRTEALGRPLAEVFKIIDSTTRLTAANPAQRAIAEDRAVELAADSVLVRRDGMESAIEDSAAPIHNRDGRVAGAVIVYHDVSQSRAMALKMSHLARHDFLTDLPNRVLLTERLAQAIGLANRHKKQVALLFIDLDDFKQINDSLGHAVGDLLLQEVADRLVECVRATDTVCRQGGDEFVILLAEIERPEDAANIAKKLLAKFSVPQHVGEHTLSITPSIGISIYPDDGSDADTVMENADTAMYDAKASGRNTYKLFSKDMASKGNRPERP